MTSDMKTADVRREYQYGELRRTDLSSDPIAEFGHWLGQALEEPAIPDPTAMVLATVSAQGHPHQRTVLLKDYGPEGFTFFTNLESHKAVDMRSHDHVSLLFQWLPLSRQIIISGAVHRTDRRTDEAYFASRPRPSQLGAWASQQSAIISSRNLLEEAYAAQEQRFGLEEIPCPPYWGGYRVIPHRIEFWQGRPNRLHDRFVYTLQEGHWAIDRLSP